MKRVQCIVVTAVLGCLAGCASPGEPAPRASMTVPLNEDLQPIADVQGPYGAVNYASHAVAIRLWPDTLDDGLAELTVIVTNGGWNTISLDVNHIDLVSNGIKTPVLGQAAMLARTNDLATDSSDNSAVVLNSRIEVAPTRNVTTVETGTAGSRPNSSFGTMEVDAALASAARRATASHRPADAQANANLEEQHEIIRAWYLEDVEIYPGDTGTGGISIPVPAVDTDMELHIRIDAETYIFPISYRTLQ